MNLTVFSKGMYSTWGYYSPARTLFDCGEGVATALGNKIFAIERILIGHGHGDHILGLPSFVGCRNLARGDKEKPLEIFYPKDSIDEDIFKFILKRNSKLSYNLKLVPFDDEQFTVYEDQRIQIKPFPVKHGRNSVGYKILEFRKRLKSGIHPSAAKEMSLAGEDIYEKYMGKKFIWTLDSYEYDLSHIDQAEWIVADATFLKTEDRDDPTHASLSEVLSWSKKRNVKRVSLAHFSSRYNEAQILKAVKNSVVDIGFEGHVDIILNDRINYL